MLFQNDNLLGMKRPTRLAVDEENGRDLIGFEDGSLAWSRSNAVWALEPEEPVYISHASLEEAPAINIKRPGGYFKSLYLRTITVDEYAITAVCDYESGQWYVAAGSFRKGDQEGG